jgi:hypothetical protein
MKRFLSIAGIGIIVVLFATCKGDYDNKIIGNWKQIPFTNPETATEIKYWQFYAGDRLEIVTINADSEPVDTMIFSYYIDKSTLDILDGPGGNGEYLPAAGDYRGQYWVDELNKKYFKISKRKHPDGSTDGAYLRVEMAKAN